MSVRSNITTLKIWIASQPNIENIPNGRTRSEGKTSAERWKERQAEAEAKAIEDYFRTKKI